jgi:hypothetical protein
VEPPLLRPSRGHTIRRGRFADRELLKGALGRFVVRPLTTRSATTSMVLPSPGSDANLARLLVVTSRGLPALRQRVRPASTGRWPRRRSRDVQVCTRPHAATMSAAGPRRAPRSDREREVSPCRDETQPGQTGSSRASGLRLRLQASSLQDCRGELNGLTSAGRKKCVPHVPTGWGTGGRPEALAEDFGPGVALRGDQWRAGRR